MSSRTGSLLPAVLLVCALAAPAAANAQSQSPSQPADPTPASTPQAQPPSQGQPPQPATAPADPDAQPPAAQPPATPAPRNDARVDPLQPDFNLVALPVTLRLPARKMSFRVTHRFNQSLGAGGFSDQLQSLFGIDTGAKIGLEFRYGVVPGTQIGIHRTSDRDIELFLQQSILTESEETPLGFDAIVTFEGQNNLRDQKSPAIGAIFSRKAFRRVVVYAEPIGVFNSNLASDDPNNTFMIGLGGRVRLSPAATVVAEWTPRVSGYKPGVDQVSFGIEGRVGGHLFQLNFSNGQGTTLGQIARGGINNHTWVLGFNIARKFF